MQHQECNWAVATHALVLVPVAIATLVIITNYDRGNLLLTVAKVAVVLALCQQQQWRQ